MQSRIMKKLFCSYLLQLFNFDTSWKRKFIISALLFFRLVLPLLLHLLTWVKEKQGFNMQWQYSYSKLSFCYHLWHILMVKCGTLLDVHALSTRIEQIQQTDLQWFKSWICVSDHTEISLYVVDILASDIYNIMWHYLQKQASMMPILS